MATSVCQLAELLVTHGIRHHVDDEERVIRILFPTRRYRNLRHEPLAIVTVEATDGGHVCRAAIAPGFRPIGGLAGACLAICQSLADHPCVAVHLAAASDTLDLVAAMPIENAAVTAGQLCSLIDQLAAAAEEAQVSLDRLSPSQDRDRRVA